MAKLSSIVAAAFLLLVVGLFSPNGSLVLVVEACRNKATTKVFVKLNGVKRTKDCRWVAKKTKQRCGLSDFKRKTRVRSICKKQCLSRCRKTSSTGTTTTITYDPFPSGPYITPNTNSRVVTLPNPPNPATTTARTGCPHLMSSAKNFHDATTWPGGTLLQANQDIALPPNSVVVLTRTYMIKLGTITIPSSFQLVIGENANGIKLDVDGIHVQGRLRAGSETCPIIKPIVITLHGSRPADAVANPPGPAAKGIDVDGGKLDLHGKRYYQTWSRLAKNVQVGDQVLLLQNQVNWEPGQKIVLVTSSIHDSRAWHQNEELTVNVVHPNPPTGLGAIVYIKEPVQYPHTANENYQVEVGLLTRMIKVQGSSSDSEPSDPDPLTCKTDPSLPQWDFFYDLPHPCMDKETTGYGGHVIVQNGGLGRVEGIELYRMGQTNVMGRYPMHFHMLQNCPACYFRHSSVHRSFYRCISVHGSHYTTVSENVAYDVTGFCYYLEDGVEEFNTLSYNLVAHVHTIGPEFPTGSFNLFPISVVNGRFCVLSSNSILSMVVLSFRRQRAAYPALRPEFVVESSRRRGGFRLLHYEREELHHR